MTQASDGYDDSYPEMALVDIIHKALKAYNAPQIKKISYDGDHHSCELIVTLVIGDTESELCLSSSSIKELFDEPEDEEGQEQVAAPAT